MSENMPTVNFPSTMNVTSPAIDAMAKSTQVISEIVSHNFKEVLKPLQVLHELEQILTGFRTDVANQFGMLVSSQIEAMAVSHQATIKSSEQKAMLVEDHIANKKKQFDDARKRISERYDKILVRLAEQHESFLRQLDSHAYEIVDAIYPAQVQAKFSFASIPAQNYLVAHALESGLARSACLKQGFAETHQAINEFLAKRDEFHALLQELLSDTILVGDYEVPAWCMEVEDMDSGRKRWEVFFEWELTDNPPPIAEETIAKLRETALGGAPSLPGHGLNDEIRGPILEALVAENIPSSEISRFIDDCQTFLIR